MTGINSPRGTLCDDGPARWYALRVTPQHEDQVEYWLRLRGVYGFHPVQRRSVRVMGKQRSYDRRYLPGYVFARFPGVPLVHLVVACPWISGALTTTGGVWGILDPARLRAIHAMRKVDAAQQAARDAALLLRRRASTLRAGNGALFTSGPLAGQSCEVVDLKAAGGASVRLVMFGREALLDVQFDVLEPLQKAG